MKIKENCVKKFKLNDGKIIELAVGDIADVSNKLIDYIEHVRSRTKKEILFVDSHKNPDFRSPVYGMTEREDAFWIFINPDEGFETDVAHEITEAMLNIEGEEKIFVTNSDHHYQEVVNMLSSLVRDYEVDKRVFGLGFEEKKGAKRDLNSLLYTLKTEGRIIEGRKRWYCAKRAISYFGNCIKNERIVKHYSQVKDINILLESKSPDVFPLVELMKKEFENGDITTKEGRKNLILKIWRILDDYIREALSF